VSERITLRRQNVVWGAVLVLMLIVPFLTQGYFIRFLTLTWIFSISVLGLRFLHLVGEINFGHIGFVAIGAYSSALLSLSAGMSFPISVFCALLICGVLGLVFGFVSMKLTGPYFFMITFALNQVIILLAIRLRSFTGGFGGIMNIPPPADAFLYSNLPYYYLATGCLVSVFLVTESLDRSYIGTVLKSIAQAPQLSEAVGIHTLKTKASCLAIACCIGGLSGSLFAHYVRFINPDCFSFHYMMDTLTYMIVGGTSSGLGSILGTLVVRSIMEAVGGFQQYEIIFSSVLLLIVMLFLREGIVSLPQKMRELFVK
jgi:branched-chain amino acid transport system permease protein